MNASLLVRLRRHWERSESVGRARVARRLLPVLRAQLARRECDQLAPLRPYARTNERSLATRSRAPDPSLLFIVHRDSSCSGHVNITVLLLCTGVPAREFDPTSVPLAVTPEQLALFNATPFGQALCTGEAAAFVCRPTNTARFSQMWLFDNVPITLSKVPPLLVPFIIT